MPGMQFIALIALAALQQAPPPAKIVQKTSGWCSPAIANVVGNVTVNCIGVDPRALLRLNAELDRKKLQLADKIREANDWTNKYKELETRLTKTGNDSELSRQAADYLHSGDLEKAGAILDQLLGAEDQQTDRTAANHYNRALVFELQFQVQDALPHLRKAYLLATAEEAPPEEVTYGREYAYTLLRQNDYGHAEPILQAILDKARKLAQANPSEYQPQVAAILNNLGVLYMYTHKNKEAEDIYREVLDTYRQLSKSDPNSYQGELAGGLNNLGLLYDDDGQYAKAEAAYKEALEIQTKLAQTTPATYEPFLADTLTDIANLYEDVGRFGEAEENYKKALDIRRVLAKSNPTVFEPRVALTLMNLGTVYFDTKHFDAAEASYKEALKTDREIAKTNPDAYRPDLALTLYNLGRLYDDTKRLKECEDAYQEAVDIYRQLAADNPAAYEADVAHTLYFLAVAHISSNNLEQAAKELEECVSINRARWKTNPAVAGDDLAKSLMMSILFQQEASQRCSLVREAAGAAQSPDLREAAAFATHGIQECKTP
jgi:tetratricopeptide (TPR) repeat protein